MVETVAIDRPSVAKPVARPRSGRPATVSSSALAAAPRLQPDLYRQARSRRRDGTLRRSSPGSRPSRRCADGGCNERRCAVWRMSDLQTLIFIAAMVVAVIAVRSISIFPSGNASR